MQLTVVYITKNNVFIVFIYKTCINIALDKTELCFVYLSLIVCLCFVSERKKMLLDRTQCSLIFSLSQNSWKIYRNQLISFDLSRIDFNFDDMKASFNLNLESILQKYSNTMQSFSRTMKKKRSNVYRWWSK